MSGRFVRASKFRHVHGEAPKKADCFTGLGRIQQKGDGKCVAVNGAFVAVPYQGGGGAVVVLDRDGGGRSTSTTPTVNTHTGSVVDIEFSPFLPNVMATGSEDCRVNVTVLPEGGVVESIAATDDCYTTFAGHQKKVIGVNFHPTTNVLSSFSGDNTIKLWDLIEGAEIYSYDVGNIITDCKFSLDGSLVGAFGKDKNLHLYDPRQAGEATKTKSFDGVKAAKIFWADESNMVGGTGFGKGSVRQVMLWDTRALDKPLYVHELDQSAGIIFPEYDPDTKMLYLAGKGDGSISYFELEAPETDGKKLHSLSQYRDSESTKGIAWLPKRFCDANKCEVAHAYRLLRDWIMPISFQVPRKSDMFQDDIYPDTYAGVPALSPEEWKGGKNAVPPTVSMKPGAAPAAASAPAAKAALPSKSRAQLQQELDAANAEIEKLRAEVAQLKAQ